MNCTHHSSRPCVSLLQEDAALRAAVQRHSTKRGTDWKAVSDAMGCRTTKQCRERWVNVLDPSIARDEWSTEEVHALFAAQAEVGNKWAAIAARLPGRPETAVKNTFYAAVRREERRAACAAAGQPVPPPFHPAVPGCEQVAAILAEKGLVVARPAAPRALRAPLSTPAPVVCAPVLPVVAAATAAVATPKSKKRAMCVAADADSDSDSDVCAPAHKRVAGGAGAAPVPVAPHSPLHTAAVDADVEDFFGADAGCPSAYVEEEDEACILDDLFACGSARAAAARGHDDDFLSLLDHCGDAAWEAELAAEAAPLAPVRVSVAAPAHVSGLGMTEVDMVVLQRLLAAPPSLKDDFSWFLGSPITA